MPILQVKARPQSPAPTLKVKDKPQAALPEPQAAPQIVEEAPAALHRGNELARELQAEIAAQPPALRARRRGQSRPPDVQANLPPHSIEAEQGVISSIMRDCQSGQHRVIADVAGKINENFFYVPAHRTIYEMLINLWRANKPLDLISFTEFLGHKQMLATVGGAGFVTQLHGYVDKLTNYVPSAANIEYYLEIVREKFARREIIHDATSLVRGAYGDDTDAFQSRVQRLTSRMSHIGTSVNGRFPQLQDTAEYFTRDSPPLPPLVIHHCLHQGSKMLLGGNSKGRKTWALMDLAISVSTGADWWGFHTHRGQVCYINLEIQPEFFELRFKKICEAKDIKPESGMLWHWPMRGHAKPMDQLIKDVLGFVQQHHFTLVIIDPIYKTLPPFRGSENDSAMITQLLNEVESITVETGAAVLFCSHFSKGNQSAKEAMDRVSGSGAWARDPDSLLMMTPHEETECFSVEGVLRNLAPLHPFVVHWDYPLFIRQDKSDPEKLRQAGKQKEGAPVQYSPDLLLHRLTKEGVQPGSAVRQLTRIYGMTPRTVFRMREKLEAEGKMRINEKDLWVLTEPPQEAAANCDTTQPY
jgi:hypothetical protein